MSGADAVVERDLYFSDAHTDLRGSRTASPDADSAASGPLQGEVPLRLEDRGSMRLQGREAAAGRRLTVGSADFEGGPETKLDPSAATVPALAKPSVRIELFVADEAPDTTTQAPAGKRLLIRPGDRQLHLLGSAQPALTITAADLAELSSQPSSPAGSEPVVDSALTGRPRLACTSDCGQRRPLPGLLWWTGQSRWRRWSGVAFRGAACSCSTMRRPRWRAKLRSLVASGVFSPRPRPEAEARLPEAVIPVLQSAHCGSHAGALSLGRPVSPGREV